MGGTGVIDRFLEVFTSYIDSGFGLLGTEVAFLSSTLVAIDITLAGLFWALASDEDVIARLIRKTLYVGFFAFLIGNFNTLAKVIFNSFAGLGLKAAGSGLSADQFVQPGRIAQVGIDAGKPILQAASQLMGFVSFFENFIQIVVLLIAWLVVLVAFFILAVQLFITLIEFKLTTLAGFVLVPFGLFNKTAFLAERVLGNVIAWRQGPRSCRHRWHRHDSVQPVHARVWRQSTHARRCHGARARGVGTAGSWDIRSRDCNRPYRGGTAARRRRGRRHRACRWRSRCGGRRGHAGRRHRCRRSGPRRGVLAGR
jgi:hypothetical protein